MQHVYIIMPQSCPILPTRYQPYTWPAGALQEHLASTSMANALQPALVGWHGAVRTCGRDELRIKAGAASMLLELHGSLPA